MTASNARHRYYCALRNGASVLDEARWAKLVDEANFALMTDRPSFSSSAAADSPAPSRSRMVVLHPTDLVVSAQTILDVEAALALAEELRFEIESVAKDDLDSARRARLVRVIENTIEVVGRRLRRGQS